MTYTIQDLYADAVTASHGMPATSPQKMAAHETVITAFEARLNDPRIQAALEDFLSGIDFPDQARVLEIGCGVGVATRRLADWPGVTHTTAIDTSTTFIERARELAQGVENVSFEEVDGRRTGFDDESFDVVVLHTVLLHAQEPGKLLTEAFRVTRSGGCVAVFDADEATVATGEADPLQACIDVLPVQNLGLMRQLPSMLSERGFEVLPMRCHAYVEPPDGGLMLSWVDRGAEALVKLGRIGDELAEALRGEARRRSESRSWFGHIAFFSAIGRKP